MKTNIKKSQVTLFIILAIVLLLIAGMLYLVSNLNKETPFRDIEYASSSLKNFINNCLKITGEEALKLITIQGRIYPKSFLTYKNNKVYYANEDLITNEEMQDEISRYINENIKTCVEPILADFRRRGLIIHEQTPNAETKISFNDITLILNFPIEFTLTTTNEKRTHAEFIEKLEIRLKTMLDISKKIVEDNKPNSNINMTYLGGLDLNTAIIPYKAGTIFFLEDSKSRIRNLNYAYSFALK